MSAAEGAPRSHTLQSTPFSGLLSTTWGPSGPTSLPGPNRCGGWRGQSQPGAAASSPTVTHQSFSEVAAIDTRTSLVCFVFFALEGRWSEVFFHSLLHSFDDAVELAY